MIKSLKKSIYYLGYIPNSDNTLKPICTYEYTDKESFSSSVSLFNKNTRIRAAFDFNKKVGDISISDILSYVCESYDELLLQNVSRFYIVGRKDESICLMNKENADIADIAVLKLDAFYTEFFTQDTSSYIGSFFSLSVPLFMLGYLLFHHRKCF